MSYIATARPIAGTLRHQIDINGRHTITTDEPANLGGTDTAPTPHELLAATLAGCVSTMIVLYAQRHGWDLGETQVDVEYDADTKPRHVEVTLRLPEGLTAEQTKRLQRVAQTCPVRRSLEAGFTFEERLAADLPASARSIVKAA